MSTSPRTHKDGKLPHATAIEALFTRNQIHEIHRAEQHFALRHIPDEATKCEDLCMAIVSEREQPSEAVMAKAHAMLAVDGVGWIKDGERL